MLLEYPQEHEIARAVRDISLQNLVLEDKLKLYKRCISKFRNSGVIEDYTIISENGGAYDLGHDFDFCQYAGIPYDDMDEHIIDIELALALLCERQLFSFLT